MYLSSVICYTFMDTYIESKMYLDKFRNKRLDCSEQYEITNDWAAVKYGANKDFYGRVWNAFFWPVTLSKSIVPWLVLTLNER